MDWNSIILAVIGVVFSWETWNNVKYRRENKKLKENEVKTSSIDAQKAQIELGDLFMEKSKEMFQQMQELQEQTLLATQKNGIDNEDIIRQLNEVVAEQKRLAEEQQKQGEEQQRQSAELKRLSESQEHMVSFLNGEYQSFLTENGFKAKKKSRYEK
jgi:hypothetical protein